MIGIQPLDIKSIPALEIPELVIENAEIQDLNGGIRKKFTSLSKSPVTYTTIYDPTLFKWDFGDGTPIIETDQRVIYHTYARPGTYLVRHQACNFCTCSDWSLCFQSIDVAPPGRDLTSLAVGSIFGFLIFKGIDCEGRDTKKECDGLKDYCQWIEKEKKCVRKCKEGYKLEKVATDDIKKPSRLRCIPHKERSKSK